MTDRRDAGFLQQGFPDALMLIVSSGRVLVTKEGPSLRWFRDFELKNLAYDMGSQGLHRGDGELASRTPHAWLLMSLCQASAIGSFTWRPPCTTAVQLPAYLLGRDGGHWKLAVDVDADTLPEFLSDDYPEALDLRSLMSELPPDQLAIAGHAAALSQWHTVRMHAHTHACMRAACARSSPLCGMHAGACVLQASGAYAHLHTHAQQT
jgi:hypothetical protein